MGQWKEVGFPKLKGKNTQKTLGKGGLLTSKRYFLKKKEKKKKNFMGQFWYHVKGLRTLTSIMSFSRSHATIVQ